MSKIGFKNISVAQDVQVAVSHGVVTVKGKNGEQTVTVPRELDVVVKDGVISVTRKSEQKKVKALHGLYRSLISNAVTGVTTHWQKRLEIVGTGYNVKLQGEDLALKLGFSHPIVFKKSNGIQFAVEGNNKIVVAGVDKQMVGQVAHQIRILKKPDAYKGKGIKYEGEKLRIKPGKKAKTAGAA